MAATPRAGTGDFACRSWRYRCSTMLNRLGNLSITSTLLICSLPPPDNRGYLPPHAQYRLLSRLLPSFSNRWVHLDTVSRQIFGDIQETQFSGSNIQAHVHLKNAFPGGIGNRAIRFGTIFGLPPTPRLGYNFFLRFLKQASFREPKGANEFVLWGLWTSCTGDKIGDGILTLEIIFKNFQFKKAYFHIWVNRNFFCSVVGALVENSPFVGKLKQIRGFVGEIQAKRSSVGEIETKHLFVGEFVTFYFTCG